MAKANVKLTSQYTKTNITDDYVKYLDIWNPVKIVESANDVSMVIESKYHKRPDLMAFDIYGSPRLWWIFAIRNKDVLIDPIEDFVSGMSVVVPSVDTVEGLF